ncbi:MAG: methylated-DNA--[protein]-cysteine S-methyltransferase [Candidatus Bathyarchaeia archaeon]
MVELYLKRIDDVWYAVAVHEGELLATTFSFEKSDALERIEKNLPKELKCKPLEGDSSGFDEVFTVLHSIFNGEEVDFNFKLNLDYLTCYQRKVLLCLTEVSRGYVTTYGSISKVAGGGARSVGNVMARNPFPLLLPCHRVVRHDLTLGNFGHGKGVKKAILMREDMGFYKPTFKVISGRRLDLFPTKFIKELKY